MSSVIEVDCPDVFARVAARGRWRAAASDDFAEVLLNDDDVAFIGHHRPGGRTVRRLDPTPLGQHDPIQNPVNLVVHDMTPTAEVRQPSSATLECRVLVRSTGKLSVGKDTVTAAQAAAKSSVALEALEGGQISLAEAAALTEFEHVVSTPREMS
jgi:hypothetical protein